MERPARHPKGAIQSEIRTYAFSKPREFRSHMRTWHRYDGTTIDVTLQAATPGLGRNRPLEVVVHRTFPGATWEKVKERWVVRRANRHWVNNGDWGQSLKLGGSDVKTRKRHSLANKENNSRPNNKNNDNKRDSHPDQPTTKTPRGQPRSPSDKQPKQRSPYRQGANQLTPLHSHLGFNEIEHLGQEVTRTPAEVTSSRNPKTLASEIRKCPEDSKLHLLQRFPGEPQPKASTDLPERPRPQEDLLPAWRINNRRHVYDCWTPPEMPGMAVGPRWWDLPNPQAQWNEVFHWGPAPPSWRESEAA